MPGIDERMTRELRRLEPPADPAGAYERIVAKRERRRIIRRAQHGVLAFVVVMGTVAGVFGLNRVFRAGTDAIVPGETVENGLIAYTVNGPDGQIQIFTRQADGTNPRAITDPPAGETYDLDPAWSPDGSTIAFARSSAHGISVFVVDADGRNQRELTDPSLSAQEPEWSPDGSMIAFSTGCDGIMVMRANGTGVRSVVPSDGNDCPVSPTWSADGTSLVFQNDGDLFVVGADGTDLRNLTKTSEAYEANPAWSPEGDRIAFVRAVDGDGSSEIWTMSPTGADLTLVAGGELSPLFSAAWSPDGQYLLIEHDEAVFRARPDGSDFRRLFAGFEPAWQPLPEGTSVAPSPSPTESPLPEGGEDIGLGLPVCFAERLGRVDYLGDGTDGSAWTAVPVKYDGACPKDRGPGRYILAVDHTGDRVADSWIDLPFECWNLCWPFDATDLDGNGTEELIVVNSFSIMSYYVFAVRPGTNGDLRVEPILVAAPGHRPAQIFAGEPLRIDAGGDAGYSSSIECEGYPSAPVIVWSWSDAVIETDEPTEVHVTRIELRPDGLFHVIDTNDFTVPAREPSGIGNPYELGPQCGVDWYR